MIPEIAVIFALTCIVLIVILLAGVLLFFMLNRAVGRMPDAHEKEKLKNRSKHFIDGKFHNENKVRTLSGGKTDYP